jgi:hypothetical protein
MLSALVYGSTLLFGSVAKPQPRFDFCSWIELFCHRVSVHGPAHESQRAKPYSIFRFPFHLRTLTAAKESPCASQVPGLDSCALSLSLARPRTQDFHTGISGRSLRSRWPRSDFRTRFCSVRRQILGAFAATSPFSASGSSPLFSRPGARFRFAFSSRSHRQALFGQALGSRISACVLSPLRSLVT